MYTYIKHNQDLMLNSRLDTDRQLSFRFMYKKVPSFQSPDWMVLFDHYWAHVYA